MNPLDLFLNRVERELRSMPGEKRGDELRELRSHLEQRSEDFQAQGLEPEAAQARAVEEFGSPRSLGSQLCDAWEGVSFSPARLVGAMGSVTALWFYGQWSALQSLFRIFFWRENVLFPELPWLWLGAYFAFSLGCGAWLTLWLGRRGVALSAAFFALMGVLSVFPLPGLWSVLAGGSIHSDIPLPLPLVHLVLAVAGA